jgi:hypothetical protein
VTPQIERSHNFQTTREKTLQTLTIATPRRDTPLCHDAPPVGKSSRTAEKKGDFSPKTPMIGGYAMSDGSIFISPDSSDFSRNVDLSIRILQEFLAGHSDRPQSNVSPLDHSKSISVLKIDW